MSNRNILFISEDKIKSNSTLPDNVWGKYLLPSIQYAQENGLQNIIGSALYDTLVNLIQTGQITSTGCTIYKQLLDEYIEPYLINKTIVEVIPNLSTKIGNIGTVIASDDKVVSLSDSERDLLRNSYQQKADFYTKRLQEWLKAKESLFPELQSTAYIKPNLDSSNNSVGLWLGGFRSKVYIDSASTASSGATGGTEYARGYADGYASGYTSGLTKGTADQKARLTATTFTENGVYTREDGWSSVTVNTSGITPEEREQIYQSGYTSGYTDGYNSGYTQGASDGFQSGWTSGYTSGVTDGKVWQKSLLVSTAITANGTYQRENGWNSVEVNVPSTTTLVCTQAEYDAMPSHSDYIIYLING